MFVEINDIVQVSGGGSPGECAEFLLDQLPNSVGEDTVDLDKVVVIGRTAQ